MIKNRFNYLEDEKEKYEFNLQFKMTFLELNNFKCIVKIFFLCSEKEHTLHIKFNCMLIHLNFHFFIFFFKILLKEILISFMMITKLFY